MNNIPTPESSEELLDRAKKIAGYTVGDIANVLGMTVPANLKKNKGWIGILLEYYLGAKSGNKPQQDFADLGIELKTIPVNSSGYPLETTFVCAVSLTANDGITWQQSYVRHKLQRVLWIPIEGLRSISLANRRIGTPILWSLSSAEEKRLEQDWQELMDMIALGNISRITARHGVYLQLRPKAANGSALTKAVDMDGRYILVRPRGFYLKKEFTATILRNYLLGNVSR